MAKKNRETPLSAYAIQIDTDLASLRTLSKNEKQFQSRLEEARRLFRESNLCFGDALRKTLRKYR